MSEKDYHLVICPICKSQDFETNNTQGAMVTTRGLYDYLVKHGFKKRQIGIYVCLSRFDPVVYKDFKFKEHVKEIDLGNELSVHTD